MLLRRAEQSGELVPVGVGSGEDLGKGCRRVNIVQILYTHVCKGENETCGNYSRNGGGQVKENDGGGEFRSDIFDILQ
jgi:hypothetical protein